LLAFEASADIIHHNASASSTVTGDCFTSLIASNKSNQNEQLERRRLEPEFEASFRNVWIQ
jgi:hypothetical protein